MTGSHIDFDLFSVRVLDGRIIALYPHILYKLRCPCLSESFCQGPMRILRGVPVRQLLPTPPSNKISANNVIRHNREDHVPAPRTTMWYSLLYNGSQRELHFDQSLWSWRHAFATLLGCLGVQGFPRTSPDVFCILSTFSDALSRSRIV